LPKLPKDPELRKTASTELRDLYAHQDVSTTPSFSAFFGESEGNTGGSGKERAASAACSPVVVVASAAAEVPRVIEVVSAHFRGLYTSSLLNSEPHGSTFVAGKAKMSRQLSGPLVAEKMVQ
jgi:hypothetical protein